MKILFSKFIINILNIKSIFSLNGSKYHLTLSFFFLEFIIKQQPNINGHHSTAMAGFRHSDCGSDSRDRYYSSN